MRPSLISLAGWLARFHARGVRTELSTISLRRLHFLVIDDNPPMRTILRNILNQIGIYDIDEATDGQVGLRLLNARRYDLIISDWYMEPLSGLDMLKKLRSVEGSNVTTPFLMVSAQCQTEDIIAACRAGANNYIIKPFSAEVFCAKVLQALGLRCQTDLLNQTCNS